jgi:hypothetical protein
MHPASMPRQNRPVHYPGNGNLNSYAVICSFLCPFNTKHSSVAFHLVCIKPASVFFFNVDVLHANNNVDKTLESNNHSLF